MTIMSSVCSQWHRAIHGDPHIYESPPLPHSPLLFTHREHKGFAAERRPYDIPSPLTTEGQSQAHEQTAHYAFRNMEHMESLFPSQKSRFFFLRS
jgi:hypothetical protein